MSHSTHKLVISQRFTWACFNHTTTCVYLLLFMGLWNMREYSDSNLYWAGDGRFCGDFPPFCIFETRNPTCHLFNCIFELRFSGTSFELIKIWQLWFLKLYEAFISYTIVTAWYYKGRPRHIITHEWVMAHTNESWHTQMSHDTQKSVMSHRNESCHVPSTRGLLHTSSRMNESRHTQMSHGAHNWVMAHTNE